MAGVAPASSRSSRTLSEFQLQAVKFQNQLGVPTLETTPEAVKASVASAISRANAALDQVGALPRQQLTATNTIGALDALLYQANLTANRLALMKETSTNVALRDAATEAIKVFSEWAVGLEYREDVYETMRAFAATKPKLAGEVEKLLAETLRDYQRAGLSLPKTERDAIERLRKELTQLTTDFESNITKAQLPDRKSVV